jgi:hypothetical protein
VNKRLFMLCEAGTPQNRLQIVLSVLAAVMLVCYATAVAMAQTQQPSVEQQPQRRVKHAPIQDMSPEGRLAVLQESLQYPPESVPIDTSYWDLLHPWSVDTTARTMFTTDQTSQLADQLKTLHDSGVSKEDASSQVQLPPSSLQYKFEMSKTLLAGTQDVLQARLVVTTSQSSDTALRIHVSQAEMIGSQEFGSPNLGSVPSSCDSTGPVCTFTWQIPSADKQYWGLLKLRANVTVDGHPGEFAVGESFYSSPMVAGKFTGAFQERMNNGSLVIDAGVDVQKRMACFISANLYSVDKEIPVQHARLRILVDPSMKTISFPFYGKIFRDYGDEGTFRLQDLKGQCVNLAFPPEWFLDSMAHEAELHGLRKAPPPPKEPSNIYFASDNYAFTTRHHLLSEFSNAEWQSPKKTARLEAFKKMQLTDRVVQPPAQQPAPTTPVNP